MLNRKYTSLFLGLIFLIIYSSQSVQGESETSNPNMQFPWRSNGSLKFYLDICQYQGLNGKTRCELSYSIDIEPFLESSAEKLLLNLSLTIRDSNKTMLDSIPVQHKIDLSDSVLRENTHRYVDLIKLELPPGWLTFDISIADKNSQLTGNIQNDLYIEDFGAGFSLSDPYFISGIKKSASNNKFEKYGLLLIPQPSRIFSIESDSCKFYVYHEINNMFFEPDNPSAFSCHYQIFDLAGSEYLNKPEIRSIKEAKHSSRIEVINLGNVKSGIYRLDISVTDLATDQNKVVSRYFWLVGNEYDSQFLALAEVDIDQYYHQIQYLLSDKEKKIVNQLNSQAKQEYLLKFWQAKDPDPSTMENEFMVEYLKKVAYVQHAFKNGIDSDMGRIYLQYGMPTEVDRQISNPGSIKSVIVWRYALNGITEFVFLDRTGDEQYILVHSNHPDEFNNSDWINDLIDKEVGSNQFK